MKSVRMLATVAGFVGGGALACGQVWAASSTGTLSVTATVAKNCTVSASTLAFGSYDPIGANASSPLDGTSTATFTCTKNSTGVTVSANTGTNGGHASGSCAVTTCTRALADGSGDYLSSDL